MSDFEDTNHEVNVEEIVARVLTQTLEENKANASFHNSQSLLQPDLYPPQLDPAEGVDVQEFDIDTLMAESANSNTLFPNLIEKILDSDQSLTELCGPHSKHDPPTDITDDQFIESILQPSPLGVGNNSSEDKQELSQNVASAIGPSEAAKIWPRATQNTQERTVGKQVKKTNLTLLGKSCPSTKQLVKSNTQTCGRGKRIIFNEEDHEGFSVLADVSTKDSLYSCLHCNYKSKYRKCFENHREHHRRPGLHQCEICSFSSDLPNLFTRHKNSHHNNQNKAVFVTGDIPAIATPERLKRGLFSCAECLYKTFNRAFFVRHRRFHTIPSMFHCNLCSYSQPTKSAIASHVTKYHNKAASPCKRKRKTSKTEQEGAYKGSPKKQPDRKLDDDHDFHPSSQTTYSKVTKSITISKTKNAKGDVKYLYHCPKCTYSCTKKRYCQAHLMRHGKRTGIRLKKWRKDKILEIQTKTAKGLPAVSFQCPKCPYMTKKKMLCHLHLKKKHDPWKVDHDEETLKSSELCSPPLEKDLEQLMISGNGPEINGSQKSKKKTSKKLNVTHAKTAGLARSGKVIGKSGTCNLCSLAFANKQVLMDHLESHMNNGLLFKCSICLAMFKTSMGRNLHVTRMHHSGKKHLAPTVPFTKVCGKKSVISVTSNKVRHCSVVLPRYRRPQTARKQCKQSHIGFSIEGLLNFDRISPELGKDVVVSSWLDSSAKHNTSNEGSYQKSTVDNMEFAVSSPYSIAPSQFSACVDGALGKDLNKTAGLPSTLDQPRGYFGAKKNATLRLRSTYTNDHDLRVSTHQPLMPDVPHSQIGTKDTNQASSNTVLDNDDHFPNLTLSGSRGNVLGHGKQCTSSSRPTERNETICDSCPQVFQSTEDLEKHRCGHYGDSDWIITCSYCNYSCDEVHVMLQHTESHFKVHQYYNATGLCVAYRQTQSFDNLPRECDPFVQKTAPSLKERSIYREHRRNVHHGSVNHVCRYCDSMFSTLPQLLCHEKRHLVGTEYLFISD